MALPTEGLLDFNHPNVEQWHILGHNGTGVRVGVIDMDFNLATATGNDLPPQINITCYSTNSQGCNDSDY